MVKLQWLQINRFRSVKPGTRLTFNPGYNVLLGQNGTGKTTLLNLVAAVVRSNFSEFRDSDFDLQYVLTAGAVTATLSVRNEQRASGFPLGMEQLGQLAIPGPRTEPVLTMEATLESKDSASVVIQMQGSNISARVMKDGVLSPAADFNFNFELIHDLTAIIGMILWKLKDEDFSLLTLFDAFQEQQARRFDESLDYFSRIDGAPIRVVRVAGSLRAFSIEPMPHELQEALTALAENQWGMDRYVISHHELPFLEKTVKLLNFESAEATIDLQKSDGRDEVALMDLSGMGFFFTHHGGWKISAKLLSYGQKRMLAFLYYLATVSSVAVADELVNGLHHRWIRAAIEAMGERQVFLTSQNPLLLDYLSFENPEQVRSTFILCRWEDEEGTQPRMIWENMSQEAAEDFFSSYKVGFQQVGELLQAKGLW